MIEIKNLDFAYKKQVVFNNISLSFEKVTFTDFSAKTEWEDHAAETHQRLAATQRRLLHRRRHRPFQAAA